ncbi:SRPBCC family protein [Roseomonas marmotae]|uniref:SRPBCC family protein n=1 Tax=Roseomonas marmotae TaxID=2768161 RepID=A0ABS3KB20_9PROT|nr:SRPBCC family protein [Roseomonas marmotae]MBO1074647.1 SRPBCC family protein [Roseomonas marmotae]QTI81667.1 SRPBCC family protein [Roseomonas marmotae]
MARIYVSDVIEAPVEQVWSLIRDFNGMPRWHPAVADSEIEGGLPSDAVGCVRSFHFVDGAHLREKLLKLSDREHECVYCILDSPLPITGYVAGYRLLPVTETDRTFIDWWAEYEIDPKDHERVLDIVRNGVFRRGFQAINEYFRNKA